MKPVRYLLLQPCLGMGLAVLTCCASAQERDPAVAFPNRVVRIVVPSGPSGPPDIRSRLIGNRLAQQWRHPVIVDNRPGAGGQVALEQVLQSPADGYTIGWSGQAALVVFPHLRKLPFDPLKDFAPITLVSKAPIVLVVNASLPAANVAELVSYAKNNPGKLNAPSPGNATTEHLALEIFKRTARLNITHIPYKDSAGQLLPDLDSGQAHLMFETFLSVGPRVKNGRLRALAVADERRLEALPNVPTFSEAAFPQMASVVIWSGFVARTGTPRGIIDKLSRDINGVLQASDVRRAFVESGTYPAGDTPDQFGSFMKNEYVRWARLLDETGIKLE